MDYEDVMSVFTVWANGEICQTQMACNLGHEDYGRAYFKSSSAWIYANEKSLFSSAPKKYN